MSQSTSHCKIGPLSSSALDLSRGLEIEENRTVLESNPPDYLHLDIIDGYAMGHARKGDRGAPKGSCSSCTHIAR